jgi:hypothetical protein
VFGKGECVMNETTPAAEGPILIVGTRKYTIACPNCKELQQKLDALLLAAKPFLTTAQTILEKSADHWAHGGVYPICDYRRLAKAAKGCARIPDA